MSLKSGDVHFGAIGNCNTNEERDVKRQLNDFNPDGEMCGRRLCSNKTYFFHGILHMPVCTDCAEHFHPLVASTNLRKEGITAARSLKYVTHFPPESYGRKGSKSVKLFLAADVFSRTTKRMDKYVDGRFALIYPLEPSNPETWGVFALKPLPNYIESKLKWEGRIVDDIVEKTTKAEEKMTEKAKKVVRETAKKRIKQRQTSPKRGKSDSSDDETVLDEEAVSGEKLLQNLKKYPPPVFETRLIGNFEISVVVGGTEHTHETHTKGRKDCKACKEIRGKTNAGYFVPCPLCQAWRKANAKYPEASPPKFF